MICANVELNVDIIDGSNLEIRSNFNCSRNHKIFSIKMPSLAMEAFEIVKFIAKFIETINPLYING